MEQRTTNPIPKTASVDACNSQLRNIDPEEFTSQIQDTNSDAVIFPLIMLDVQGRVVAMNDAAISLTGFSLDDCLGRGLELFHAEGSVEFSAPNAF